MNNYTMCIQNIDKTIKNNAKYVDIMHKIYNIIYDDSIMLSDV